MTEVDLITGFLGAGKTTFILRYGAFLQRQGTRFAVIENEFGAAGIDTALLSQNFHSVGELSGGCICCTLKLQFHEMLSRLSATCERILVEPSGIFNMDDFFDVMNALERQGICRMGMCVTVVDPHTLPILKSQEQEILRGELIGTGVILWSKVDLQPVPDLDTASGRLSALLEDCTQDAAPLRFCQTAAHMLTDKDFQALQCIAPTPRAHARTLQDHRTLYQSTSLQLTGVFDAAGLSCVLDTILDHETCGKVLRVKGFVRTQAGSLAVNCTVSDRLIEPCTALPPILNIIGNQLDRIALRSALECAMK